MQQSKHHKFWSFPIILILGVLACNFPTLTATPIPTQPAATISPTPDLLTPTPDPTSTPDSTPFQPLPPTDTPQAATPKPIVDYQPVFEPGTCAFFVPSGFNTECGYLVVPENRARADSPLIRLHVAVFPSRSQDPAPDPVVHLAGGPGSSSLAVANYLFRQGMDAVLEYRDLILFDQRGTGFSQPRLDCPEREALTPNLLDGSLSPEEKGLAIVEAFRECRARLREAGVDLSVYQSAASAADVNDLRQVLGYERVNLYAVSYGTRLALTVLRDYPQAVRSAVLDSTYPPQVNLYTSLAPNAERAFNELFEGCAEDVTCQAAYPDLREVFYDLVDDLNDSPIVVEMTANGVARDVRVDGDLLIDVLFVGLYNPAATARMPKMIFDIRRGDTGLLRNRLQLYFDSTTALGMQMAVQCNEEIPFSLPEEAMMLAEGVQPQIAAFFPKSVQPLFEVCQEWRSEPLDQGENQPVESDVPVLVLAGEYDPITPPDWGKITAETISNAYYYEFPGNGHWVTRSSSCAREMALKFWDEPGVAPDSACLQTVGGLEFVGE